MQAVVRGADVLARLGGDEFLVVAERIGDSNYAGALARRLIEAIAVPVECAGLRFTIRACVGVAMALDGHDGPGQLLAHADLALYRAKARGCANIEIYDKSLQDELRHRDDIEQALALALSNGTTNSSCITNR
jgi:diguanylate cyclase (GGDEF)-like protein